MPKATSQTPFAQAMKRVEGYVADLDQATPLTRSIGLAALLAPKIDHIRVFRATEGGREMVRDIQLAGTSDGLPADTRPEAAAEIGDAIFKALAAAHTLREVREPDFVLDIIVDPQDGSVSLDVETERTLIGQDLSLLSAETWQQTGAANQSAAGLGIDDAFLSASEAARLLGVDKSTVTRRVRNNEVVGFKVFKKSLRIPRAQFDKGDVVAGIGDVIALFDGDHRAAWYFLTDSLFYGDPEPRPLDRLRGARTKSDIEKVLSEFARAKTSLDHGNHI